MNALQEQNIQVAAGLSGRLRRKTSRHLNIRLLPTAGLAHEEQFESIIVRTSPVRLIVYLKDVARVELGKFSYSSNSFVDGNRASYLIGIPGARK